MLRLALWGLAIMVGLITIFSIRLMLVLCRLHALPRVKPRSLRRSDEPASLAVFLGSGGHTAEMMRLIGGLDFERYSTRTYIISAGDMLSEKKAIALEHRIGSGTFQILWIPRARRVHQSYLTSPFTTLHSLAHCLWLVTLAPFMSKQLHDQPRRRVFADLILLNGPGSCVPIACAAFIPRLFGLPAPALIYVESLARTRRLSMSAKLVRPLVNRFFVQWQTLRDSLVHQDEGESREGAHRRWWWWSRWKLRARVEYDGWLV